MTKFVAIRSQWVSPEPVVSVQRLSARAGLDDSPAALGHAKTLAAAGDESWEQWVAEYQRGEALIVRLELCLELAGAEDTEVLSMSRSGLFVENHFHAPQLEQQIAELASGDLAGLAEAAAQRGHCVDAHELVQMYVHVELDPELRSRLQITTAAS